MNINKLKSHIDSLSTELQQSLVRVAVLTWGLAFFAIGLHFDYYHISIQNFLLYGGLFLFYSLIVVFSVYRWPNVRWRLYSSAVIDIIYISLGIIFTGDSTSPFFILYLWVLISQAIRFGRYLLYTVQAFSFTSYLLVALSQKS